jgi:hypothetical protein
LEGDFMPEYELSTLKLLRRFLIVNGGRVRLRRVPPEKAEMRSRLDETLLPFRVARRVAADPKTAGETGS